MKLETDAVRGMRINAAAAMVGRTGRIIHHDGSESTPVSVVRFEFNNRGEVAGLMVVPVEDADATPTIAPLEAFRPDADEALDESRPPRIENSRDAYLFGFHLVGILSSAGVADEIVVQLHDALNDAARGVADALADAAGSN